MSARRNNWYRLFHEYLSHKISVLLSPQNRQYALLSIYIYIYVCVCVCVCVFVCARARVSYSYSNDVYVYIYIYITHTVALCAHNQLIKGTKSVS